MIVGNAGVRWLVVLALLSLLAACVAPEEAPRPSPALQLEPTRAPTATTPPPEPTAVPAGSAPRTAPTNQPPDEGVIRELQEEILVSWVAPYFAGACDEAPEGAPLPALEWRQGQGMDGALCLWGFSEDEAVAVEVRDPTGELRGAHAFTATATLAGPPAIEVPLTLAQLPLGEWTATAVSKSARLKGRFEVLPARLPVLYVVAQGKPDIFAPGAAAFAAGQALTVVGAGFAPGGSLPLGIYSSREEGLLQERLALVYAAAVVIDADGRFAESLAVEPSDPPGKYYAIVPVEPGYQPGEIPGMLAPEGALASFEIAGR